MTKRSSGLFSGRTRNLARHHKPLDQRINTFIKEFEVGDKVAIVPKGNVANSPHPRYKGRIGTVIAKRGKAYTVKITIMGAVRELTVPVMHLEKAKS